jgi:hypothetical protein
MIDSKEALFSVAKARSKTVDVPDSDEKIELFELDVKGRTDYFRLKDDHENDPDHLCAFLICRACRFLNDDDIEAIKGRISAETRAYFGMEVLKLSGLFNGAEDAALKK